MEKTMNATWYNFATDQYENRGAPSTDEEARQYIPQEDAARGLYSCHRAMGKSVLEALGETLAACIGERF